MIKNMMLKTALWPLQKALYQRLTNYPDLQEKVSNRVYDSVAPEGEEWFNGNSTGIFPYILLGDDTLNDYSTKLDNGEEITHTLIVWSNYPGKKEVKEVLGLILAALSSEEITLDGGFTIDDIRRDYMEVTPNGDYFQGILRLRLKITQS